MSCDKKDKPIFINDASDGILKYQINLIDNKILEYSKFVNDELIETTSFNDLGSIVEMITTNASNLITKKITYSIGDNHLANSAIDSSFSNYGLSVAKLDYEYQNTFLLTTIIDWKRFGEFADSGQMTITNIIEGDNIISSKESFPSWPSGCTDFFRYNSEKNKIDIKNFTSEILGKPSKNLISHTTWNNGCPCGPSSSEAYSDFRYELDNNGFVTKRIETYTPCYSYSFAEEVTRKIKTTIYEYNAR